ncbi:type III-A CRISPR-associated protein Csm2 [Uruburuella testudinis]|uniref:CRISPR system Cms protein Csm2 n=1 Tax=Uruburuella testudinis TaxID=1282863 RepID=A0ABY4DQA6_9NEIS|nr:type III-A CRISPR-associated protein Csm2 [Uruburuella testudinis]UOO81242.1 type III-A CRISPR-associated protein Csm2 [Uruburuella testudinis]
MNLKRIELNTLQADIFSDVAKEAAEHISPRANDRGRVADVNKSTQLRKFYDELAMWHDKVFQAASRGEAYQNAAPFIQMLKAKAAYSQGRGHVDGNFVAVFNQIISQINSADTLKNAKLFFEAVLGFRKANEQK